MKGVVPLASATVNLSTHKSNPINNVLTPLCHDDTIKGVAWHAYYWSKMTLT